MTDWASIVAALCEERYVYLIGLFAVMAMDVISGLIGAFASNSFSSTKMKEGAFHKAGIVVIALFGLMIDIMSAFIEGLPFQTPLCAAFCVYLIGMEAMSIVENVVIINPELKDSKIIKMLLPSEEK